MNDIYEFAEIGSNEECLYHDYVNFETALYYKFEKIYEDDLYCDFKCPDCGDVFKLYK